MDAIWQDVRSGVRSLTTARGFTAVAVLVFALGIGINTALFSVVYAVFFRPLPVRAPGELVYLYEFPDDRSSLPFVQNDAYRAFLERDDLFAGVTSHSELTLAITIDGETEMFRGEDVHSNYFDVLGVKPALGRPFQQQEDSPANPDLALVISHSLWVRRFNSNPGVIGTKVRVCCRVLIGMGRANRPEGAFTIVGVAPKGFRGTTDPWNPTEFWMTRAQFWGTTRTGPFPIARIRPGLTYDQAREIVRVQGSNVIADRKRQLSPRALQRWRDRRMDALPINDVRTPFNPTATLVPAQLAVAMTTVVIVVLLIAIANVGGLLTARGVTRGGEIAVRRVLGASPLRIARQLLAESVSLAVLGGLLGVPLAWWMLRLFQTFTPNRFSVETPLDARVLAITGLLCLVAGVITGLAPVMQLARGNILASLPGSGLGVVRRITGRLRHWVVIPQVALALVLLVAAGLQVRALMRLELADLGYDTTDRVVLTIALRPDPEVEAAEKLDEKRAERSRAFHRQVRAALLNIRGAAAASVTSSLPTWVSADGNYDAITQENHVSGARVGVATPRAFVDTDYFRTMGIRLLAGRDFDERDSRAMPLVVIINETLARRLWPGLDAVGRTLTLSNNFPGPGDKTEWYQVIGVVNDVDAVLRDKGDVPIAYLAMSQQWQPPVSLLVAHLPGASQAAIEELKRAVTGADLFADVTRVRTMNQEVADILYPRRMTAGILAVSGFIGLMLASVGLYGVISYSVAQRQHELGVRSALGASRHDIIRLVLREGGRVVAAGTVLGAMLAYGALQVARERVAGMPPLDAVTLLTVPVVLLAVVLFACYIPARRAARVDPLVSLRAL